MGRQDGGATGHIQPGVELTRPAVCPFCGASPKWNLRFAPDIAVVAVRDDMSCKEVHSWHLCHVCGNGFPSRPIDLRLSAKVWSKARSDKGDDPAEDERLRRYRMRVGRIGAKRAFANFAPLHHGKRPGRFLDVACGHGDTAKIFLDHGWQVLGIDADPSTKKHHELLGIETQIGQIETLDISGPFDIVHIAHAIYFVQSPRDFLDRVRGLLADDGLFCVTIADFMSSNDSSLPGQLHSFFPTGASMRNALAQSGLPPIWWRRQKGSIHIACRKGTPSATRVFPRLIRLGYATKGIRYVLWGRGRVALGRLARRLTGA